MVDVILVAEGQTEEAFTKRVLAPQLADKGVFLRPQCIPTSQRGSGGALGWNRLSRFLRNTLRERNDTYVTTFFDLYGLKPDFPGLPEARRLSDPLQRAVALERGFHETVINEVGCRPERFFPHIQPYEFESLLFSDVEALPRLEAEWQAYLEPLRTLRRAALSPEHINDGQRTHPSAQLRALLLQPPYDKRLHGPSLAGRIGIARIRQECAHFDAWLSRIEKLTPLQAEG